MPQTITIDNTLFEVWSDKVLWSPPSAQGQFVPAPDAYAEMARALVLCDFEDRDGHSYVVGKQLFEHFIDTHDDKGNEVPSGRPSGIHFPLRAGMGEHTRIKSVLTGMLNGKPMISVLEWIDPLNTVMTTSEAEETYGLKVGSAKKAAQRNQIPARKSGGTWLIRKQDAIRKWG